MANCVRSLQKKLVSIVLSFGFSLSVSAQTSGVQTVANEYIIKIKSKPGVATNSRLSVGMKLVNKVSGNVKIKEAFWGSEMLHIKSESQAAVDAIRANPEVEFVEPNYLLSVDPVDIQPFGVPPTGSDTYDQSN